MSTVTTFELPRRHATPPRWPTAMLGAYAVLATLSLLQGFADVVLPILRGEAPFRFLLAQTAAWGDWFFVVYVFVHNLGLACLVPGYGFLAAWFERRTVNRGLIGVLLAGAVVVSLAMSLQFVFMASYRFDLAFASALFMGEAAGVLVLAVAGARELRGFVPTREYGWALVTPFRRLAVPLAYSATLLALLSVFEAFAVLH